MATRIFLTGGGGFVGRRTIDALLARGYEIAALDRSGSLARSTSVAPGLTVIQGDLLKPESYRDALASATVVVHLAASTGRASRDEHFRINAVGTDTLLAECRRAGVTRFLFVSSIAASFPDTSFYHYAQAKIRAEDAVRTSGLAFVILRPTMILGRGSPILLALEKLAMAPVVPVFGAGRARVQPVHVDDVAAFIAQILDEGSFKGETFDIGGPEALPIEDLIQRIRQARTGAQGRTLHLPLWLVLPPLKLAEAAGLGSVLPLSVGQLATFRFDGVVTGNPLYDRLKADLVGVSQMLALSGDLRRDEQAGVLERECHVFTRFLLGVAPSDYVTRKYVEGHAIVLQGPLASGLDARLLGFARKGPIFAKTADSYARLFLPAATLRRKLVLLLAILETCPPFYRSIDAATGGAGIGVWLRLAVRGTAAIVSAIASVLIFVPMRLMAGDRRQQ